MAHFGHPCPPLTSVNHGIDRFASQTHCVGLRLNPDGQFDLYAPFGLHDIFAMRIVPNYVANNRETHHAKAARALSCWPELTVIPWRD